MTTYLLAGGGTAGHVNPLLAVADALRDRDPDAEILVLGTREGLEARLVPERGYELLFVDKVPFPRRPNRDAAAFPGALPPGRSRRCARTCATRRVDVVVGFGGYASAPAYVAARRAGVPVVVHEANAKPGMANMLGARTRRSRRRRVRRHAAEALDRSSGCRCAERSSSSTAPRFAPRRRELFGLDADRPTLLVFGGSLGRAAPERGVRRGHARRGATSSTPAGSSST